MIIKNGTIYDAVHREPFIADIRIEEGKIREIEAKETENE